MSTRAVGHRTVGLAGGSRHGSTASSLHGTAGGGSRTEGTGSNSNDGGGDSGREGEEIHGCVGGSEVDGEKDRGSRQGDSVDRHGCKC